MRLGMLPRLSPLLKPLLPKTLARNTKTCSVDVLHHTHSRNIDAWIYETHTEYHIPLYNDIWNEKDKQHSLIVSIHMTPEGLKGTVVARGLSTLDVPPLPECK